MTLEEAVGDYLRRTPTYLVNANSIAAAVAAHMLSDAVVERVAWVRCKETRDRPCEMTCKVCEDSVRAAISAAIARGEDA